MSKSYAEIATEWQGTGNFPGHDIYQNGIINKDCNRLYIAGWQDNWANASWTDFDGKEHLSASGYFTDQATIDACISNDKLDTNKLDAALQTKLSDFSTSLYDEDGNKIQGNYQAHSHVCAYDIDYERLAELKTENQDIYNRLTNPDDLSVDSNEIKVAYGQAEANFQNGSGGGNQYYIDPQIFKDGLDAGVFNYNPAASFSDDGSTGREIIRVEISPEDYRSYDGGKYNNDIEIVKDIERGRMKELANKRELTGISKAEQINGQRAIENPDRPYITFPDPSYSIKTEFFQITEQSNISPRNYYDKFLNFTKDNDQQIGSSAGMPNASGINKNTEKQESSSKGMPNCSLEATENQSSGSSKGMPNGSENSVSNEQQPSSSQVRSGGMEM